ncbi:IS3 family transposase [Lachnospiraceae bacterium NSJ-12]|uniref:IS3 family transposase n=1 Tax=Zhenhengia yiwuensis TaxID=2763666 RepID=A0A926ENR2_9FIRM|nr:IS3 family transposase [Zhenhengia yiwuensis]MBC8581790.1 IS3 family transposase [Zhenhengia yiwuensis]
MAKYSFEFKKKVVQAYLNGEGGAKYLSNKYKIASKTDIQKWVASYKKYGDEGLMRSRKNENYSFEFKIHVVELYLTREVSYQELALSMGVNNPSLITRWVNDYRITGPDALKPKRKGRRRKVDKSNNNISQITSNDNTEYIKQLEDELLKLKIENAYLKELRRLRLEGIPQNKKRESSTASEDPFKLKDILAILGFPKSTYMYWQKRFDKEDSNKELEEKILAIRKDNKDFGYRRIYGQLRKQGLVVNKKRVQRIVQKLGIQVQSFTRKSRKYSSYKGKVGKVSPNRIHRRFETHIPHQKITTDTSEFKYYEVDEKGRMVIKKLYLDPFMDLCNREIVSYGISKQPSAESIMKALNEAIEITSDCQYRRIFHSDQGWAYQMKSYIRILEENKIFQSMSRKGNCHDNAVMENFFGIMKQEMYYGKVYYSYEELKVAIEKYIKYYNEQRIKEKLGWMSPVEYRVSLLAA